jgi:subtilisin family serine protease
MIRSAIFTILYSIGIFQFASAQTARTWVFFSDKGQVLSGKQASYCLSERAVARLNAHGLLPGQQDLPVCGAYVSSLRNAGLAIHTQSRWLNAVSIEGSHSLESLQAICPQVMKVQGVGRYRAPLAETGQVQGGITGTAKTQSVINYGAAQYQTEMFALDQLHDLGFTGQGVLVAMFDSGFEEADNNAAFDSLWLNGQITAWYDFVDRDTLVFQEDFHGAACFSFLGANQPGTFVGTAPHSQYILARTEDVGSERHIEEDNWLEAMEWADSLGVNVISTSLGYTEFDPGEGDYTYADMDGNTTIITRAADLASSRGILCVVAAGNSGNSPWFYISAPCDGDSVLCVGAVDFNRDHASFSSYGPSFDGRVKPDVVTMGHAVNFVAPNGQVQIGSGTSFACPQIAGLAASLWSAHPQATNMRLWDAIRRSADRYANPDSAYGHGIPNARIADSLLALQDTVPTGIQPQGPSFQVSPNPFRQEIRVQFSTVPQSLAIWGLDGRKYVQIQPAAGTPEVRISTESLGAGLYFLEVLGWDGARSLVKIVRTP